jgi:hypothetical protein
MEVSETVMISGELDTLANLAGHKFIVELKSYDGYYAKKQVQGNKSREGMPKPDHVAQNMFYLSMLEEDKKHSDAEGVLFHYRTRADLYPTYHVMTLDKIQDSSGNTIDSYPVINGKRREFISMRGLLVNGLELANYIESNQLPPRKPEYQYSEEKIRYLLAMDEIAKSKYKDWQEGKCNVGDWQCNPKYCKFFNLCRGQTPWDKNTLPSDDQIMTEMHKTVLDNSNDIDNVEGQW